MTLPRPRLVRREQVLSATAAGSGLTLADSTLTPLGTILADSLRHFLCHPPLAEAPAPQPLHVSVLRAAIARQFGELGGNVGSWAVADESDDRDPFQRVLHKLVVMREAEAVGNGFYLPTPLRLIEFPGTITLAIGGLPTWAVARRVGRVRAAAGLGRILDGRPVGEVSRQSYTDWLGPSAGETAAVSVERGAEEWQLTATQALPPNALRLLYALAREERMEEADPPLRFRFPADAWAAIGPIVGG